MNTPHHSPDGLTYQDITALQREVTAELRREGHLPQPRHHQRRRQAASRPKDATRAQTTRPPRDRAARRGQGRGEHQ